jgi:hypothetical protein
MATNDKAADDLASAEEHAFRRAGLTRGSVTLSHEEIGRLATQLAEKLTDEYGIDNTSALIDTVWLAHAIMCVRVGGIPAARVQNREARLRTLEGLRRALIDRTASQRTDG